MMNEMMKGCCNEGGLPDFEKMKAYMEKCGKRQFTEDDIKMMQQFCSQSGKPDAEEMKQLIEKCGCRPS